jgi:hypothetical protein
VTYDRSDPGEPSFGYNNWHAACHQYDLTGNLVRAVEITNSLTITVATGFLGPGSSPYASTGLSKVDGAAVFIGKIS